MPVVARTRAGDRAIGGIGDLRSRCLEAGLPLASSCSGRGACGRCAFEVLAGAEALPPSTPREREVLARNGADPGWRLACCCEAAESGPELLIRTGYW